MADANRKTVDELVLHHAVTPLWSEKSKKELAQWFSDNGFARAYGSNPKNWSGLYNPYTGAKSYSQAHYAGQRVTDATPDATADEKKKGYRLVPLVKDPWSVITWHAGNWEHNRRSIGIENLGDYRNYTLRENDCKVIADFWRPQDQKLKGKTAIFGHKEVSDSATACPARLMEKRQRIVDLVNQKDSGWEVITTKDITTVEPIAFTTRIVEDDTMLIGDTLVAQEGKNGERTIVTTVTYVNDVEKSRKEKSNKITKQPVEHITVIGTKQPEPQPEPEKPTEVDNPLVVFLEWLIKLIKDIWNKEK